MANPIDVKKGADISFHIKNAAYMRKIILSTTNLIHLVDVQNNSICDIYYTYYGVHIVTA